MSRIVNEGRPDPGRHLDELSAYEVAVLTFTSPQEVDESEGVDGLVTVTGKDAYLWAGAVTHILISKPDLNRDDVVGFFDRAIAEHDDRIRSYRRDFGGQSAHELGLSIIRSFLEQAELSRGDLDRIAGLTAEAVRHLEHLELIEDPFMKRIMGLVMGAVLLVPVNFTSKTVKGKEVDREISAITWQYDEKITPDRTERHFKLKVREIAKTIKDRIVPALDKSLDDLSGGEGNSSSRTGR